MAIYNYRRRPTVQVRVGDTIIGSSSPVRLQSMGNVSTLDTEGAVAQALKIASAGGELVRFTTQGVREASNMAAISGALRSEGCRVPLVADVHFNPAAAFEAARHIEKVRINPGNFVDPARTFRRIEYSDEEYAAELQRLRSTFVPLLDLCRERHTALRLGVNHGSLSDRIMSRYGNTPSGMVESAMEFLRICREENFDNVVVSLKSSSVPTMVEAVELMAAEMEREGMSYPLHLGVTEAGDGEDGRIKSAVGIGSLLAVGLGDTIRVSLSEPPENEVPVARKLRDYITLRSGHKQIEEPPIASSHAPVKADMSSLRCDARFPVVGLDIAASADWHHVLASDNVSTYDDLLPIVISSRHANPVGEIASFIDRSRNAGVRNPFVLSFSYPDSEVEDFQVKAGADLGALLLRGYGDAISLSAEALPRNIVESAALTILQACRLRISKTEYIACPSCGRTLFDLPQALHDVRQATNHLRGLKIGVMGCIVNGPGEMADADYGYVGAGPGRVSLYKGKELIIKNIPTDEALPALIELIKEGGDWTDPE